MMKKIFWCVVVAFVSTLCGVTLFGHRATLLALEPLRISKTIDGQSNIAEIAVNTRMPVVRCIDTKSLIIPEVQLADQKIGYAVYGKFKMEYASALSFSNAAPISFSCR
jgi:hypothetical protein